MNPSRRTRFGVILMALVLIGSSAPPPAWAQRYESLLRSLDYGPDPFVRSPRLLGMGRLTLADDLHNRIDLWNFAGSPVGIASAETVSVIEYRPGTRSSTAIRHLWPEPRERQELHARQVRHGVETWRRNSSGTAYGLIGDVNTLEQGRPFSAGVEERQTFVVPVLGGVVNGRMPWVPSTKFDYALRVQYAREGIDDLYFDILQLPQGQYLGQPTAAAPPPDVFTPTRVDVSTLDLGASVAMRVTSNIKVALGYDKVRTKVKAKNDGVRSSSTIDERRPFNVFQGTVIARVLGNLELGLDGRAWRAVSEELFSWTVSAGQGQVPLSGSGKRLDRTEEGTLLRTRLRLTRGPFELGASLSTSFRRLTVTPWYQNAPADPRGFNTFLDEVAFRSGADTLILPSRVRFSRTRENGYEAAGGLTWHLPSRRGQLGAEYHRWRRTFNDRFVGTGPQPVGWDVRAGGEYRLSPAFTARGGWGYGLADDDNLIAYNTYRHATATAGFGVQPMASSWSVDVGFALEWLHPDFVEPTRPRETRQQLGVQVRWPF